MDTAIFQASMEVIEENSISKYVLMKEGVELTYAQVLSLWQTSSDFRSYFIALLADSPFDAYRWETPAISIRNQNRPFEFVLINSPSFSRRRTDRFSFASYFSPKDSQAGIVTFDNLGGNATLVVPSPRAEDFVYGHLAAFIRMAPMEQVHWLWQVVGQMVGDRLHSSPLWLNTAGGGVAWLHVRLDSQPKYYHYDPYTTEVQG